MAKKRKRKNKNKNKSLIITIISLILYILYSIYFSEINNFIYSFAYKSYDILEVPDFQKDYYVYINNNIPNFNEEDKNKENFACYSDLDLFKRAGVAYAKIGIESMPTKERESIGMVKPTGWHLVKYDNVEGKYLYNRCHLIAYQLTGENANPKNLITCTRHMNANIMLEFENRVANYIKKTNNHVLYRVTPIYKEANLLASGVQIEAESIEDNGKGIKFNVYIYNVQDGIEIDYKTGNSKNVEN